MGMFDEKQYLTGKNGLVQLGEVFHLHDAGIGGMVRQPGRDGEVPEAYLLISKNGTENPIRVYTTGTAIVGQVQRVDAEDREAMNRTGGRVIRLGALPQSDPKRSPAFILEVVANDDTTPQNSPDQTPGVSA